MSNYLVIDLETTGETTYKRQCNPLDLRHSITSAGFMAEGFVEPIIEYNAEGLARNKIFESHPLENVKFIIGQNIKFDMLWFWKNSDFQQFLLNGGKVWDTQTVEYLLSGQRTESRNLNTLSLQYGGTIKDDRVSVMFESGMKARDIPKQLLCEYNAADVSNTSRIAKLQYAQVAKAPNKHLKALIWGYMDHYLAITEMEYNGMYYDLEKAEQLQEECEQHLYKYERKLFGMIEEQWPDEIEFNAGSLEQQSAILFGGTLPGIIDAPVIDSEGNPTYYKTGLKAGQRRTRKEKVMVPIKMHGMTKTPGWETKNTKGFYKTDENNLKFIAEFGDPLQQQYASILVQYRECAKLLHTYILGFLDVRHPDGCVHTEFGTAFTRTGRLNSRNPNLQNILPQVTGLLRSRWGDDGVILEFDYHQLEVVIQAYLSQSPKFMQDVIDGVDFHCKRLSYAEDLPYEQVVALCATSEEWKLKRKKAKVISFQKAYGAQESKIAESCGLPVHVIESVFRKEDDEYPEIKEFYDTILQDIQKNRKPLQELVPIWNKRTQKYETKEGEQAAISTWTSITGKRYTFSEKAVFTKNGTIFRYWPMTEIYNYPIQGTAADIMAIQVGKVFRALLPHRDKALLINEVHDSLILDVKKDYLDLTITLVRDILENVDKSFKDYFGLPFNIPITVEYGYGATWEEAKRGEE